MSARGAAMGAICMVVGGLTVAGAATAPWAERTVTRTIGDAQLTERVAIRGLELTDLALPVGLGLAAMGIVSIVAPAGLRRVLAAVAALATAAAFVELVRATWAAPAHGRLTAAPGLAMAGTAAVLAGAWLLTRSPVRSGLPPRFDLDADADDEWRASAEPEENP